MPKYPDKRHRASCLIGEGTIYQKKDMLRSLETFGNLRYEYIVDGKVITKGEGRLTKVFASKNSATLIINRCIFINVFSFDYLNFKTTTKGHTLLELVEDSRMLKLESRETEKPSRPSREIIASVDHFDDEETFALLEDSESDEED